MTPATMSIDIELMRRDTSSTNNMAMSEPANAEMTIMPLVMTPDPPTMTIITSATTSFAPELMPRMNGPAMGLLKNVCSRKPESASAPPNKAAEMKLSVLFGNFLETGLFYLRFWPLLLSFALFYVLALRSGVGERLRLLALVYLGGSLAGHFVLTFALYCAGRSTYIGLALLLAANALLVSPLLKTGEKKLLLALCALCMAVTVWKVYAGVTDILRTDYLLDFNRELIEEAAANGETELQVPRPYAHTKYSALEGLPYLNTEDPTDWPNVYMAKYYGVNSIIGY